MVQKISMNGKGFQSRKSTMIKYSQRPDFIQKKRNKENLIEMANHYL